MAEEQKMSNGLIVDWTKESLFREIEFLEGQAFAILSDFTKQDRYHAIMNRVDSLSGIAKEKGWV